jgi:HEPN domain-containing protein
MPPDERGGDPHAWLNAAREHLSVAGNTDDPVRVRCFCGQRAVELSLKAVLIHGGIEFPYTHTLEFLVKLMPDELPSELAGIGALTPYAVEEMYPDTFTELGADHAHEAVELARAVVSWATSIIEPDA